MLGEVTQQKCLGFEGAVHVRLDHGQVSMESCFALEGFHVADSLKQHAPDDLPIRQAVRCGSIYKEILRYLREVEADLVIMSAHRPGMRDFLLGPNAARVVRHANCSVWVVRD